MHNMIRRAAVLLTITLAPTILWAGEGKIRRSPRAIKGEYIVVLNDETPRDQVSGIAERLAKTSKGSLQRVWKDALKGCFIRMTEGQAFGLSHHPDIKYIEENAEMFLSATDLTRRDPACDPAPGETCIRSDNRLWHLDVVDQNAAVGTGDYSYCETGSGVHVYVIDTGVLRAHREFSNDPTRVLDGYDATGDPPGFPGYDPCGGPGEPNQPDDGQVDPARVRTHSGHGTGVGSLVAGQFVGVARAAKIVPIKVRPCAMDGARTMNYWTFNKTYATNEIVYYNGGSSIPNYYKVVQGGSTGGQGTNPTTGWPTSSSSPYQTWGTVQLGWLDPLPSDMTQEMTIEGLDWILRPENEGGNPYPKWPAVVTLSTYRVAGPEVSSLEDAIGRLLRYDKNPNDSIVDGITVIASANNQDADACSTTPGRMSRNNPNNPNNPLQPYKVITAGGTMLFNNPDPNPLATGGQYVNMGEPVHIKAKPTVFRRWRCHAGDSDKCSGNIKSLAGTPSPPAAKWWNPLTNPDEYIGTTLGSNGGKCVTLFAPAKNIPVADLGGLDTYRDPRATDTRSSGTSWSAPIVAGMVARILQSNQTYTVDQVHTALMSRTAEDLDLEELNPPGVSNTPRNVLRLTPVYVYDLPLTTPAATTGDTSISVSATGPAPLTYELYEVHPEFDVTQYHNNDALAAPIQGPQSSPTFSVPSIAGRSYFVRVRSTCGTADTNITTIEEVPVSAPSSVLASATAGTVTISWNSVVNATGYRVERKTSSAAWHLAQTVNGGTSSWVTDNPSSASGVVLYRVFAANGTLLSDASNSDVAFVGTFSDDPVVAPGPISAEHITELRAAVNGLLSLAGHSPAYTASQLDPNNLRGLAVDDNHFETLRQKLNDARFASDLSFVYFGAPPAENGVVSEAHLVTLRTGMK